MVPPLRYCHVIEGSNSPSLHQSRKKLASFSKELILLFIRELSTYFIILAQYSFSKLFMRRINYHGFEIFLQPKTNSYSVDLKPADFVGWPF